MAEDRIQYMAFLFTGKSHPELEEKVRKGEITTFEFIRALIAPLKAKFYKNLEDPESKSYTGIDLVKRWRDLGVKISDADEARMREIGESDKRHIEYFMFRKTYYLETQNNVDQFSNHIFGNDQRFEIIKKMEREGRIHVLTGDLLGTKALSSIGKEFRKHNIEVGVLDVSNVPGYFTNWEPSPDWYWQKLKANLEKLPFHKNGKIHFTNHNNYIAADREAGKSEDGWYYFSLSASKV